ncbi:MAG: 5'-methylthioadenosine/S-adenosylhomocysteine nucleosidase [Burkholderiaceae bacterium]
MKRFFLWLVLSLLACHGTAQAGKRCLSDCTPRIGIVSAFGAEADILVAQTQARKTHTLNGNRFTTGVLRGNRVVIVLSGVSMINATMVTQLMLDHFKVERLVMSGIAGGLNPDLHVGDVTVPDRWVMSMELYWNQNSAVPQPCGKPTDVSCLGLKLATGKNGQPFPPPFTLPGPQGQVPTGLFMRENFIATAQTGPKGKFMFEYPVDPKMFAVASRLQPKLLQCGPSVPAGAPHDPRACVRQQPRMVVGGVGVTGTTFLANADYRKYLFEHLKANTFEMETAGLAHVAHANGVPYIAFRSLSDLAGGEEFDADVVALFTSGLAEANEAAVTLAFLEAWKAQGSKP